MDTSTLTYPARLVITRKPTRLAPDVFVTVDNKTLTDQAALGGRLLRLEELGRMGGCGYYHYTPVPEAEAETVAERMRAELVAEYTPQPAPEAETVAEPAPAPEPVDYLGQAAELARAKWAGNPSMLRRVDKALALARAGKVWDKGGGVWWVACDLSGVWSVNGACGCPDYTYQHVTWCKHRIAVALVRRAAELKKEAESADTPSAPEAPKEDPRQGEDTTGTPAEQVAALVGDPNLVIVSWVQESPTTPRPRAELQYSDGRQEVAPVELTRPLFDAVRAKGWPRYGFDYHRRPCDGMPPAEAERVLAVLAEGLD